jgi:hypothetical protein
MHNATHVTGKVMASMAEVRKHIDGAFHKRMETNGVEVDPNEPRKKKKKKSKKSKKTEDDAPPLNALESSLQSLKKKAFQSGDRRASKRSRKKNTQ